MRYTQNYLKIMVLITAACILANFSSQEDGQTPNAVHATNFFGIITPLQGDPIKVENISISGLFENIPVYAIPANVDTDPSVNTTRLRLTEITSLNTVFDPNGKPKLLVFKGRDYIEIAVQFKDKTIKHYIIERSRQIFCYESFDALPKREFSFEGIKKLLIEGFTTRDRLCDAENKLRQLVVRAIGNLKAGIALVDKEDIKNNLNKIVIDLENGVKEIAR